MRAIFAAYGPSIKNRFEIQPFQNIELYNFFTGIPLLPLPDGFSDLLALPITSTNNGTRGALFPIMTSPPKLPADELFHPEACLSKPRVVNCVEECSMNVSVDGEMEGGRRRREKRGFEEDAPLMHVEFVGDDDGRRRDLSATLHGRLHHASRAPLLGLFFSTKENPPRFNSVMQRWHFEGWMVQQSLPTLSSTTT